MTSPADIASALENLRRDLASRGVDAPLGEVNWTYDAAGSHVEAVRPAGAVIMGFNAGAGGTGSEARWKTKCGRLTDGIAGGYMLAELVLIASLNIAALRRRHTDVDDLIERCSAVNRAVIDYHQPQVIFQTGFDYSEAVTRAYGLTYERSEPRPASITHVLLKHYRTAEGRPWLVIRHPSSFGFSGADVEAIRTYVAERCGVRFSS